MLRGTNKQSWKGSGGSVVLGRFFKLHGWRYLPGLVFLVANALLAVLPARILGEVIDVLGTPNFDVLDVYKGIVAMVVVAVLIFITRYIWRYFIMGNSRRMETFLRRELFTHFQSMSMHFYNHSKTGDLIAYAINDISAIRQTFGPGLSLSVNGIVMSLISIASMGGDINLQLTIYALLPVPVLLVLIVVLGRQVRQRFRRVQEAFAAVSDRVQENISGIRVIKAYAQEDAEVDRFERLNQNMLDTNVRMVKASATMSPMVDLVFGLSFTIALVYGSALVRSGAITLGDFVAFNGYLTLIVQPIRSIARVINILSRGMASLKRYNQIMAVPPMVVESVEDRHPQPLLGELEVRDLSFRYPYAPSLSLQNISFHLEPGKTLGILGHTGSGKTTLCNLLLKLYNPPEGAIFMDGVDITPQQVYEGLEHEIPKTSLPSGEQVQSILEQIAADGYEKVFAVCISSGLSGTFNMVRLVAQDCEQLETFVLDTRNISIGSGGTLYASYFCNLENVVVSSGGVFYLHSSNCNATFTTVEGGGSFYLSRFNNASGVTVGSGGLFYVASAASAFAVTSSAGANITVETGGYIEYAQ